MKRLLLKLLLFFAPFAAIYALALGLAVYSGEAMPLSDVIPLQQGADPVLYGVYDIENMFAYKYRTLLARQPDVLVLGSSRMLQFRDGLVTTPGATFYNAAANGWQLPEVAAFLDALPADAPPDVVILGIDQGWFNADAILWQVNAHHLGIGDVDAGFASDAAQNLLRQVLTLDLPAGNLLDRRHPRVNGLALGYDAQDNGRGYRADGSFVTETQSVTEAAIQINGHLATLAEAKNMFQPGDQIDEAALTQLDRLLGQLQVRGMQVIGITPPYAGVIYARMMASGRYAYLPEAVRRVEALFAAHNFALVDISDAAQFAADSEMSDGWHPSEQFSARIYLLLLEQFPDLLTPYSDADTLRQIIADADDPFHVFGSAPNQ